jgi:hypothetical protein
MMYFFHFMEKEKKKEKKITAAKEGFPGARPALLAVSQVPAVRCN